MPEADERASVIAAARSWLLTPFHDGAQLKGVGVDCANLLAAAYEEAGIIPKQVIPPYSPQWMLHDNAPLFEQQVLRYAHEIEGPPLPGDVVLYRVGKLFAHGGIVVEWPEKIIHAFKTFGFVAETPADEADLRRRERRFFTVW